jgi:hypothetical protein
MRDDCKRRSFDGIWKIALRFDCVRERMTLRQLFVAAILMGLLSILPCVGLPISAEAKTYAALAVVPKQGRVYHGYAK